MAPAMIHETRAIAAEGETLDLDPFGFWPDVASRIVGLGGDARAEMPDYAFHTRYVVCGTGPIVFTLRFSDLRAQRGTLIMRVHELPEVMGAQARQIAISQAQLADLVRGDGRVALAAVARGGNSYALIGFIHGDTVATANEVTIEVARRTPDPHDPSRPTSFQADQTRVGAAVQIVGEREGALATPVSQLCTERQTREPIFSAVLQQLSGRDDWSIIDQWERVFVARVLDRYDAARSGARGLGIGAFDDPLGKWLIGHGCLLTLTSRDQPAVDPAFPLAFEARQLDPFAIEGLAGFDFAWATRSGGVGGSDRQEVLRFIEDILRALKPGGLLAVIVPIDVAPRAIGDDKGQVLRRPDIDRIVLLLLSRGHQVALVCPWGDAVVEADDAAALMISAFGLVIRKAS